MSAGYGRWRDAVQAATTAGLRDCDVATLAVLGLYSRDGSGAAWPGRDELARRLSVHPNTITARLARLRAAEVLEDDGHAGGRGLATVYRPKKVRALDAEVSQPETYASEAVNLRVSGRNLRAQGAYPSEEQQKGATPPADGGDALTDPADPNLVLVPTREATDPAAAPDVHVGHDEPIRDPRLAELIDRVRRATAAEGDRPC